MELRTSIYYHLLCQFPSCREASYFQETGPPGFGLLSGKMIESALSIEKVEPKNHFLFSDLPVTSSQQHQVNTGFVNVKQYIFIRVVID